jgi:putative DNA primase/helicase
MTRPTPARPSKPRRTITPELIRAALASIPPDVDRETWARLAMAIKSELSSAAGFALWSEWSADSDSYDPRSARDTWRSIKAGGAVTIGTLFGLAKDNGFRFPEEPVQAPALSDQAQAEAQRLAETRRRQREAEAAEYRRRAERAARDAAHLWAGASEAGASPYLQRKGVQGHGVRHLADGTLLVPMRDAAGELHNVQRIAPAPPADGSPEKRFLPGGRKSGLFHLVGQADGAAVLLLAEGYATAATVHEATGRPAVVGFDAGNLVHVAKTLRERWPAAALLVCADDDRDTEARTGKNPGRDKAEAAARAARTGEGLAAVVLPEGVAAGGSDFNDLAAHAGLPAVAALVEAAAAELVAQAVRPAAGDTQQTAESGPGGAIPGADDAQAQPATDSAPSAPDSPERSGLPDALPADTRQAGPADTAPALPDPFTVNDHGVWHVARDAEGNEKRPVWLCTRLVVTARTRTDEASGWGYLLEFTDPDGNAKTWAMPSALLSGEGAEWAGRLRDMGLRMATGPRPRNLVAHYIDTRNPPERVICTDRVGWHGPVYVLPSGSIAAPAVAATGRRYVFQSDSGMEDTFRRLGDLAAWQRTVAAPAAGNSRIVFALCCAFAGPMLRLAGMESGGFHLRGGSSQGKTTALKVAASVWGRPSYMQRWRTTDNALEATAVQHCDGLLILDEFGQLDPRVAGECAYMLANDQEKGRATRAGLARKRRTWRLLFLSSGEVSLADHMAEAGKRTRAGMEVRMLDVPLDSGAGMGGLEVLHGHEGPGELADAIVSAAASQYGTAGRAWLEWACEHHAELPQRLQELIDRHRADLVPEAASEQVRRAGSRFALVATAGELATQAGITGWAEGEALQAARRCFAAWLGARGHLDNGEDAAMLQQVRRFLELNGEGRFAWWHRAMDDHTPKTLNRAGFRRLLGQDGKPVRSDAEHQREYGERMSTADGEQAQVEFIVLREVFRREVCQGFDADAVAKLLQRRGHLVHETDRLTVKHRLPGIGKAPCFHVRPSVFSDEL